MAEGNQMNIPGSNNISVQSVQGGTVIINQYGQQFKIPHEITYIPYISLDDVVGRDDELSRLYEQLHKPGNNITTVVNGLGGVGKTTLAQAYISRYKDKYGHKVWFTQNPGGDFMQDVCNAALIKQKLNISSEIQKNEDIFNEVFGHIHLLESADNKNLPDILIIDNADENLIKYKEYLPQHWHVLVTSRNELTSFRPFKLDFLVETEAVELFKLPYRESNDFIGLTDDQILGIVKMVDCHTLTLSILSRSAKENDWSYLQVKNALQEDKRANILHPYTNDEKIDRIKTFLSGIFNLAELNEHQLFLLYHMALMPSEFIPLDDLKILLNWESLEWKDDFMHHLRSLHRNGWLMKTANEEKYKLHIIISDIAKEKIKEWSILEEYISNLSDLLAIDQSKDSPIDKFKWIPYGDALIIEITKHPERKKDILHQLARLQNELGRAQKETGNYKQAKDYYINSLEIAVDIFGEDHQNVAAVRNNLAIVYKILGDFTKALQLFELGLSSDIKNFGENHPKVAVRRNNLASTYQDMGNLQKAVELAEQALKSDIINFGENHPKVAIRRNNLATIYKDLGNLQKAVELAEQALNSDIENFDKGHLNIARSRNTLAAVFIDMGRYVEAISILEAAYVVIFSLLGEDHPNTKTVSNNLELAKRLAAGEE